MDKFSVRSVVLYWEYRLFMGRKNEKSKRKEILEGIGQG
jgi:hypothetical protein